MPRSSTRKAMDEEHGMASRKKLNKRFPHDSVHSVQTVHLCIRHFSLLKVEQSVHGFMQEKRSDAQLHRCTVCTHFQNTLTSHLSGHAQLEQSVHAPTHFGVDRC